MKQITQEKFLEILKSDESMAKRLAEYIGDVKDEEEVGRKTIEFAKNEGYDLESKQVLNANDLEDVAGGAGEVGGLLALGAGVLAVTGVAAYGVSKFQEAQQQKIDSQIKSLFT